MRFVTGGRCPRIAQASLGMAVAASLSLACAPLQAAANKPVPAGTFTGPAADVAGRYAILRGGGKDTGCMLTLDDKTRGPAGSFKAILAPGCGDQGLLIFDPVGWEIVGGRLALVARKGHETHLDKQPDGTWNKDPKEGAALELKKM
jgi:hypothetical protein